MGQVEANTGWVKEQGNGGVWLTLTHHKGAVVVGANIAFASSLPDFATFFRLQNALIEAALQLKLGGDIADFRAHLAALPSVTGSGPFPTGSPASVVAAMSDDSLRYLAEAVVGTLATPYVMLSAAAHGG